MPDRQEKTPEQREAVMAPRLVSGGSYIRIPYGPDEGGADDGTQAMVWPNPDNGALSYALRGTGALTRSQRLVLASIFDAYRHLILSPELTQKDRNRRIASIRAALKGANGDA